MSDWVEDYRDLWERRLDRLEDYLSGLQEEAEAGIASQATELTARLSPTYHSHHTYRRGAMQTMTSPSSTADREIVTTRLIDAPRALVFEAWTDPKHVAHWFGPDGFVTTTHSMEVRPGGVWRFTMRGPDGKDWPNVVTYEQVVPPSGWSTCTATRPSPTCSTTPSRSTTRMAKTALTMRAVFKTAAAREFVVRERGAVEGGQQTIARLDQYVRTMARSGTN